ncbi:MAG: class I SAM-dependent methyltransferase [Cyanobium sp.]
MTDTLYWDDIGAAWVQKRPQRLWRDFADRHQFSLVARWFQSQDGDAIGSHQDAACNRVLKTDLFDEVAGTGIVSRLAAAGLQVTAVDLSPVIVAATLSRHPELDAFVADVRAMPFEAAQFDYVFSGSTLDHFDSRDDIQIALCEIRRVMRPGGRLILTMDNPVNPLICLRNSPLLPALRGLGIVPYQVGATLAPRALAKAVRAAGFDPLTITAVMHCPRVIAVALARLVERLPSACGETMMDCLMACERLEPLPSRWITGHYIAVHAIARSSYYDDFSCQATAFMP